MIDSIKLAAFTMKVKAFHFMVSAQLIPLNDNPPSLPKIELPRPITLIGRHVGCDARLHFAQISRRHCCVIQSDRQWIVRDLGSRNGVYVNGHRVQTETTLRSGDEIAIGHLLYRLVDATTA